MDFQKLVEIMGFPTAQTIAMMAGKSCPEPQTFDAWRQVCYLAPQDSNLSVLAITRMKELARSFREWCTVCNYALPGSDHETAALAKVKELSKDILFDQWCQVCYLAPQDSNLSVLAITRMKELARSSDEWCEVCSYASPGSDLETVALAKVEEFSKDFSFHQWENVFEHARSNKLEALALQKMGETALILSEWCEVCYLAHQDKDLETVALAKVEELSNGFSPNLVHDYSDDTKLHVLAIMVDSGEDTFFDKWYTLYRSVHSESEFGAMILRKMAENAETFDQWFIVCEHTSCSTRHGRTARTMVAATAETFDQCRRLFANPFGDRTHKKFALKKIGDFLD